MDCSLCGQTMKLLFTSNYCDCQESKPAANTTWETFLFERIAKSNLPEFVVATPVNFELVIAVYVRHSYKSGSGILNGEISYKTFRWDGSRWDFMKEETLSNKEWDNWLEIVSGLQFYTYEEWKNL